MVVKLYKFDASPAARAAMIGCELFKVPVELVDVNFGEGEHFTPAYLKKNPLHTVPVLEDGDLFIQDSHAILMYLADVYGKEDSFYPKDIKQRAVVNQRLFFNAVILYTRLKNLMILIMHDGVKEIPKQNRDELEEAYGFLEEFLSRTKYVAGNSITIADIEAYTTASGMLLVLELNAEKYPKTQAWLQEIGNLPYVKKQNSKGHEIYRTMITTKLAENAH